MSAKPILNPLQGERVVGLTPTPSARITDWNRRLNLFPGRALTSAALYTAMAGKTGRIAQSGQARSAGIVNGLELSFFTNGQRHYLEIGAGFGLAASGEDVVLAKPVRIALGALPVYTTAAILDGAEPPDTGDLAARRLGPSIEEAVAKKLPLPKAGVIVLQPVTVDELAGFDPAESCEEDPARDAFSDEQWRDGSRVVYYAWPTEWLPLPAAGEAWRNRLAYAIFEAEAANEPNQVMPWDLTGLPLGLVAFDENWAPLFVDCYAVAREGGTARRRTFLVPGGGHESLWQARIQQFADHVAGLAHTVPSAGELSKEFRYLPPAGLLPKNAMRMTNQAEGRVAVADFFPGTFTVKTHPAPVEQLDLIPRGCGSLAAFDTAIPDQVTVVVPVPQIWYEPGLLEVARIDPGFQLAINQFSYTRAIWLKHRLDLRETRRALESAITGKPVVYPEPDPDAVEEEPVANEQVDPSFEEFRNREDAYGTSGTGRVTVDEFDRLKKTLATMPGVSVELAQLEQPGNGLEQFTADLQARADHANDLIDTGFVRVQTDIYRVRQKMLGNTAASRLAVSPALAEIAQGTTGLATEEKIESYLESVKGALKPPETSGGGSPPHEGGGPPATPPEHPPPHEAVPPHAPIGGRPQFSERFGTMPRTFIAGSVRPRMTFQPHFGAVIMPPPHLTPAQSVHALSSHTTPQFYAAAATSRAHLERVRQQRAIVGADYGLRNTSVAERLHDPPTAEVKLATVANKVSVISNFRSGGPPRNIAADDIELPGFLENGKEIRKRLGEINDQTLGEVVAGLHDPIPDNPGEAQIFAAGVRAIEHTIEILRLMEQRVQIYLQALELCHDAMDKIGASATAAAARLQVIDNELGKTRHDVAVAKALMAEEQSRIDRVNARRTQIVTEHVRFLVYYRPRTIEARTEMPRRALDPGVAPQSIPACTARNIAAPNELREYVNLMREAPLAWFRHLPATVDRLDRLETLHRVILNAKYRASFKLFAAPQFEQPTRPGPLATSLAKIHDAHLQVVNRQRLGTAQADLAPFGGMTWKEARDGAMRLLSIGDLADLGQHQPEVPRVAAAEVENIFKVAASLYSDFCTVAAAIRLNWAKRLIQIDATVNLANLASLLEWEAIPLLERREMQALADWLFSRINPAETEAVAHVNDLIRVCILLASHEPVTKIITGDVIHDTSVTAGAHVNLTADTSRVHVGMHVLLYHGNRAVARGVVENLTEGVATARVLTVSAPQILLDHNSKAHFASADAFKRHPLTASLKL